MKVTRMRGYLSAHFFWTLCVVSLLRWSPLCFSTSSSLSFLSCFLSSRRGPCRFCNLSLSFSLPFHHRQFPLKQSSTFQPNAQILWFLRELAWQLMRSEQCYFPLPHHSFLFLLSSQLLAEFTCLPLSSFKGSFGLHQLIQLPADLNHVKLGGLTQLPQGGRLLSQLSGSQWEVFAVFTALHLHPIGIIQEGLHTDYHWLKLVTGHTLDSKQREKRERGKDGWIDRWRSGVSAQRSTFTCISHFIKQMLAQLKNEEWSLSQHFDSKTPHN